MDEYLKVMDRLVSELHTITALFEESGYEFYTVERDELTKEISIVFRRKDKPMGLA